MFQLHGSGQGIAKRPFPAWFVCREKPGRGRRQDRATSRARCKVSLWALHLTLNAYARTHTHTHTHTHSCLSWAFKLSPVGSHPWANLDHSKTPTPLCPDSARRHLISLSSRWTLRTNSSPPQKKSLVTRLSPSSHLSAARFGEFSSAASHCDGQRAFVQLTLKSVKLNKTLRLVIGGKYQLETYLTLCHTFPSSRVFLWKNKQENLIKMISSEWKIQTHTGLPVLSPCQPCSFPEPTMLIFFFPGMTISVVAAEDIVISF